MSLCKALPIWFLASNCVGTLIGKFVMADPLKGLAWGFVIGSTPIWLLLLAGIWVSLVARDHPKCRCGRWKSGDYQSLDYSFDTPMYFDYRCLGCGRHYRQQGRRLLRHR